MAEGSAVLRKPGNAGGGKGPWLKADARSDDGRELGDEPDNPLAVSKSCRRRHRSSLISDGASLLREPGAANPHVRFGERVWKRTHGGASEAPTDERVGNR
jgi:hypothetical protein